MQQAHDARAGGGDGDGDGVGGEDERGERLGDGDGDGRDDDDAGADNGGEGLNSTLQMSSLATCCSGDDEMCVNQSLITLEDEYLGVAMGCDSQWSLTIRLC